MYAEKIIKIRAQLASVGAAGAVLSTQDNIFYASGFSSVMDGWHLMEPIAAVFVPTDAALPLVLILPEASIISLIVSARAGHPVYYEGIATFELLNFCETARAEDAHLALPEDLLKELGQVMERVEGHCEPDIIQTIAATLSRHLQKNDRVLFDDLRVAAHVESRSGQRTGDALDVMLASRVIKTPEELDTLRESGAIADDIMTYTLSQLSIGATWADVEKPLHSIWCRAMWTPCRAARCYLAEPMTWCSAPTYFGHALIGLSRGVKSRFLRPRVATKIFGSISIEPPTLGQPPMHTATSTMRYATHLTPSVPGSSPALTPLTSVNSKTLKQHSDSIHRRSSWWLRTRSGWFPSKAR